MPSRFVRQPDGRLAVFSTVVHDFTACGMSPDEAFSLSLERDVDAHRDAVHRGMYDAALGYGPASGPVEGDGLRRWREALDDIRHSHRDGKAGVARAEKFAAEPGSPPVPLTHAELAAALASDMPSAELVRLGLHRVVATLRGGSK